MYLKNLFFLQPIILLFSYDPTGNFHIYIFMKEEIQVKLECP